MFVCVFDGAGNRGWLTVKREETGSTILKTFYQTKKEIKKYFGCEMWETLGQRQG